MTVVVLLILCVPSALRAQGFTDVTSSSGISYVQFEKPPRGGFQTYMSGGAAAGDFDGDGWIDLYVTRLDNTDILYRNQRDGTFVNVTNDVFGTNHMHDVQSNGVGWADIDNDDDLDLYVTSLFSNRYHLFINHGRGSFTEEAMVRNAAVAGADEHFGFSVSFGDYDRDGFLDIHTNEWRRAAQNSARAAHNTRLLRNLGTSNPGFFEDVTEAAGVAMDNVPTSFSDADSQSFTSRFDDFDNDGWPDLAIASDHQTSRLFWNQGDGTFRDGTAMAHVGSDQFGMGSAIGDVDGDGDLDWFVSSIYKPNAPTHTGNRLYLNRGNREFVDGTEASGVRDGAWGWGSLMMDHDNDGDLDIVETNGQRFPFAAVVSEGFENSPLRLWQNDGAGIFVETANAMGLTDDRSGKGLLTFDYDNDGDLDLFVSNNGGAPVLYRNQSGNDNNWLQIQTRGESSNRQGIGARIIVDPDAENVGDELVQVMSASSNFLSQSPSMAHFGLGSLERVDGIRIEWPSGVSQWIGSTVVNRRLVITEPVPEPESIRSALVLLLLAISALRSANPRRKKTSLNLGSRHRPRTPD